MSAPLGAFSADRWGRLCLSKHRARIGGGLWIIAFSLHRGNGICCWLVLIAGGNTLCSIQAKGIGLATELRVHPHPVLTVRVRCTITHKAPHAINIQSAPHCNPRGVTILARMVDRTTGQTTVWETPPDTSHVTCSRCGNIAERNQLLEQEGLKVTPGDPHTLSKNKFQLSD